MINNETPVPYEPKKSNRFIVEIGEPFNIPYYVFKKISRPRFTKDNQLNDITLVMYDPIHPSTTSLIMNGLEKLKTKVLKEIILYIKLLSPIGEIIEEWRITGEMNDIDFGELDYQNDENLTIKMVIRPNELSYDYKITEN
jgi:hypothetical protein